ncbi:hypothetical protein FA95DRAFT_1612208 [Auriscalpium vulgare]|uniref:Uncharacterized protein n=1 Tax=Auriscalpium vulgare TaxID=40419 RepID=A0ACB8R6Z9_9AGAM|nr:hypothetical protein FA95DRAFT_1612208 [Auriscalpium vulgare]
MAHQAPLVFVLAHPGQYTVNLPHLRAAWWVDAQPPPSTNAGAPSFPTASTHPPGFGVPSFGPAVPASLATPPPFTPAIATPDIAHAPAPAFAPAPAPAPALTTTAAAFASQSPTPPAVAAPVPTPFFAAPAFLTGAWPFDAAGASAFLVGAASSTPDLPSAGPRTPPPSPAPPTILAAAAADSLEDNAAPVSPVSPAPIANRRTRARRARSTGPRIPSAPVPPTLPTAGATGSLEHEEVPVTPLTPAPVHARNRVRRPSSSPPPVPTTQANVFRLRLDDFGRGEDINRDDPLERLEI